jgi:meso-butanediol dehydrogenase/(S,S)-butanediol dehydrogenase/diacetyl reductase
MRGLKNKRVLVTGGAKGIGAATAARFIKEGARVAILDIDRPGLHQIKRALPRLMAAIVADVSKPKEVAQAYARLDALGETWIF